MTVRTPAKVITEVEEESDDSMEHEVSSGDEADSDEEAESENEIDGENESGEDVEEGDEEDEDDGDVEEDDEGDEEDEDDEEEEGDEDGDEEEGEEDDGNAGWADALSKVLQQEKPKNKKYLVLSKAKKLADRTDKDEEQKLPFEIEDKDDADTKPDVTSIETKPTTDELELAAIARKDKNNKLQGLRVNPSQMDIEREKSFKRIAQRGVVQLFNAVRSQQRDLVDKLEKAGPLDHKRDEVLNNINKRKFLDMLMGSKRAKSENIDNPVKNEDADDDPAKPSQWSVLKDDFMSNKSSHWNDDDGNDDDDDGGADNDNIGSSGSDSD